MLKKTIKYTNFNGEEETETFYFNMTRAELIELEYSVEGGFSDTMMRMIQTDPEGKVNGKTIMAEMKKLILGSYGQRSTDGKRFIKNDELRKDFESSEAYSALFMELVTDAEKAAEFINGIVPKDLAQEAAQVASQNGLPSEQTPMGGVRSPEDQVEPRVITRADLASMSIDEFNRTQTAIQAGTIVVSE